MTARRPGTPARHAAATALLTMMLGGLGSATEPRLDAMRFTDTTRDHWHALKPHVGPLAPVRTQSAIHPALALLNVSCTGSQCPVTRCKSSKQDGQDGVVCEDDVFYPDIPASLGGKPVYGVSPDRAVRAFLETHPDTRSSGWDEVVLFTTFHTADSVMLSAYYMPVRNEIRGIMRTTMDKEFGESELFDMNGSDTTGSAGYLKGVVLMSDWHMCTLPRAYGMRCDTEPPYEGTQNGLLGTLSQEVTHRWGTYFHLGKDHDDLPLGRDRAHWSYFLDSEGSPMEGNQWEEKAPGKWTLGAVTAPHFSPLDLYAMGLLPPDEVGETRLLVPTGLSDPDETRALLPTEGPDTLTGTLRTITVDEVIASEGKRVPAFGDAPRTVHLAFALLERDDAPATEEQQATLERLRQAFTRSFYDATGRRMRAVTTLSRRDDLPLYDFVLDTEGWQLDGAAVGASNGSLSLGLTGPSGATRAEVELPLEKTTGVLLTVTAPLGITVPGSLILTRDDASTVTLPVRLTGAGQLSQVAVPLPERERQGTVQQLRLEFTPEPGARGEVALDSIELTEHPITSNGTDTGGDGTQTLSDKGTTGCGCSGTPADLPAWMLLGLAATVRRRSMAPPS